MHAVLDFDVRLCVHIACTRQRSRLMGWSSEMVRILTAGYQSRAASTWADTEVEVIEYGELQDVARPIGSPRVSLRAALRETGGHIEARHHPSRPLTDAYRGSDHLSLIERGGEAYGHTPFIRSFRCVAVHFSDALLRDACDAVDTPHAADHLRSRLMRFCRSGPYDHLLPAYRRQYACPYAARARLSEGGWRRAATAHPRWRQRARAPVHARPASPGRQGGSGQR